MQNARSLNKSREGLTATGPFSNELGHDAENEHFIAKILDGTLNPKQYSKFYPSFHNEAEEFIRQMKTNQHCKKMKWTLFGTK